MQMSTVCLCQLSSILSCIDVETLRRKSKNTNIVFQPLDKVDLIEELGSDRPVIVATAVSYSSQQ